MRKGLDDLGDLLELAHVAVLATYRRDGTVLLSPVWHEWRDNGFNVVTASRDVKAGHLRRDPRASIVVCEDDLPNRGLELRTSARLSVLEDKSVVCSSASGRASCVRGISPTTSPQLIDSPEAGDR